MKNYTRTLTGILVAAALVMPVFASAQSTGDVSSQIQSLMSQITALQQQLHTLMGSIGSTTHSWSSDASNNNNSGGSGNNDIGSIHVYGPSATGTTPRKPDVIVPCINITRDLGVGSQGNDVTQIQGVLSQAGFLPSTSTTGFFGKVTAHAVSEFAQQFGITGSTTGSIGSNIRNFFKGHCGDNNGNDSDHGGVGSTTRPTPCADCGGGWGPAGSTTHPCPAMHTNNGSDAAAVALALFEPHSILPPDMHPCNLGTWHSSPGPASSTVGSW